MTTADRPTREVPCEHIAFQDKIWGPREVSIAKAEEPFDAHWEREKAEWVKRGIILQKGTAEVFWKLGYAAGAASGSITADQMLDAVVASLRMYPSGGGDVRVMSEVERIVKEAASRAQPLTRDNQLGWQYRVVRYDASK